MRDIPPHTVWPLGRHRLHDSNFSDEVFGVPQRPHPLLRRTLQQFQVSSHTNPHNARLSLNLKTNQQGPTEGHRVRQPRTEPKNHRKRRCTKLVFFKALRKHDATITLPTCKTAIELRAHHMLVNVVLLMPERLQSRLRQPLIASPLQIRKELLTTWLYPQHVTVGTPSHAWHLPTGRRFTGLEEIRLAHPTHVAVNLFRWSFQVLGEAPHQPEEPNDLLPTGSVLERQRLVIVHRSWSSVTYLNTTAFPSTT